MAGEASLDAQEDVPMELDPSGAGPFLVVDKNKLGIRYAGPAGSPNQNINTNVGSIQANCPAPRRRRLYYYEVTVRNTGDRGCIAVGYAPPTFKAGRQPGWEPGSYGYHGDDGYKFSNAHHGEDYGPHFGTGDVIGAGLHLEAQELFFTKNGAHLGVAFRNVIAESLVPTVGLHSQNEAIEVNFGAKPFAYDVDAHVQQEQAAQASAIAGLEVPAGVTHQLVRAYLQHFAYAGTLAAFDAAAGLLPGDEPPADSPECPELKLRHQARLAIDCGDVDSAEQLLRASSYAHLLTPTVPPPSDELQAGGEKGAASGNGGGGNNGTGGSIADAASDVHLHLSCQKFVELLRGDKVDEAVAYGQKVLSPLLRVSPAYAEVVTAVFALIAYQDPAASPLAHLLSPAAREATADVVNSAILAAALPADNACTADMNTSEELLPEAENAASSVAWPSSRRFGPPPPPPPRSAGVANGGPDSGGGRGRVRQRARRGGGGGGRGRGGGVGAFNDSVMTLDGAVLQSAQALVGISATEADDANAANAAMNALLEQEMEEQLAAMDIPPPIAPHDVGAGASGSNAAPAATDGEQQAPPRPKPAATLQRLLAQLAVVRAQMHQANADQGEMFWLNDHLVPPEPKPKTA